MTEEQLEMKFLTKEEYRKKMILRLGGVGLPAWMIRMYSIAFATQDMTISGFYAIQKEAMKEWDEFVKEHKDEEYVYTED